ncbi:hypothetical protein [Paenibacillus sp. MBLB4367]|uniref:hypothetical protein n=1 Tax=Paenibacillus sp. MBLB4367 TaxID=3384767 RepID=UPI0039082FFE
MRIAGFAGNHWRCRKEIGEAAGWHMADCRNCHMRWPHRKEAEQSAGWHMAECRNCRKALALPDGNFGGWL